MCQTAESSLMISWLLTSHPLHLCGVSTTLTLILRLMLCQISWKVQEVEEQTDEGEERVNPLEGEELCENVAGGGLAAVTVSNRFV